QSARLRRARYRGSSARLAALLQHRGRGGAAGGGCRGDLAQPTEWAVTGLGRSPVGAGGAAEAILLLLTKKKTLVGRPRDPARRLQARCITLSSRRRAAARSLPTRATNDGSCPSSGVG